MYGVVLEKPINRAFFVPLYAVRIVPPEDAVVPAPVAKLQLLKPETISVVQHVGGVEDVAVDSKPWNVGTVCGAQTVVKLPRRAQLLLRLAPQIVLT
jgi:hypothetical protein